MIIAIKNGINFVDCYLLGRLCTIWSGYIFQYPLQFYSSVSKFSKLYNFNFTASFPEMWFIYNLNRKYDNTKILLQRKQPQFSQCFGPGWSPQEEGLIVKNVLKSQSRFCLCCFLRFIYTVEPLACENSRFSSLLAARDLSRRINVCDPATEIPHWWRKSMFKSMFTILVRFCRYKK